MMVSRKQTIAIAQVFAHGFDAHHKLESQNAVIGVRFQMKAQPDEKLGEPDLELEDILTCPITFEVMKDPVVLSDRITYERAAIDDWLRNHNTSPSTNLILTQRILYPNLVLKEFLDSNITESTVSSTLSQRLMDLVVEFKNKDLFVVSNGTTKERDDAWTTDKNKIIRDGNGALVYKNTTLKSLIEALDKRTWVKQGRVYTCHPWVKQGDRVKAISYDHKKKGNGKCYNATVIRILDNGDVQDDDTKVEVQWYESGMETMKSIIELGFVYKPSRDGDFDVWKQRQAFYFRNNMPTDGYWLDEGYLSAAEYLRHQIQKLSKRRAQ